MVGQYCAPKLGTVEIRTKNNTDIDLIDIVNNLLFSFKITENKAL
jgi:hypothetical protein